MHHVLGHSIAAPAGAFAHRPAACSGSCIGTVATRPAMKWQRGRSPTPGQRCKGMQDISACCIPIGRAKNLQSRARTKRAHKALEAFQASNRHTLGHSIAAPAGAFAHRPAACSGSCISTMAIRPAMKWQRGYQPGCSPTPGQRCKGMQDTSACCIPIGRAKNQRTCNSAHANQKLSGN